MIGIKSSMSADKIKGPIVIFTKAKKKNSHAPQGLELLDLSWEPPTGVANDGWILWDRWDARGWEYHGNDTSKMMLNIVLTF